ncbi:hypothetical protein ALC53_09393 [Atta colombica]|uniref:DUF4817 domain-containing protein n=1 Tax=Atta colombica TaxID=520822 RepID=A0A195B7X8_9HYME|nr:hypothetical protein ALC53_09393 [Atta colombica]
MGRYTLEQNWEILKTYFQSESSTQTVRIISRNADVNWPPCSCDLTPLDYFLWGTVKDECYANTVENVLKNWIDRMGYYAASCGSHLNEIVFHV